VLPTAAVVLLGLKVSPLFAPTTTVWTPLDDDAVVDGEVDAVVDALVGVDDEELVPPPPAGGPY